MMRRLLAIGLLAFAIVASAQVTTNPSMTGVSPPMGAGVTDALAVGVGTAGSFVVNGGVLGTPLSGTATNLTGTASGLTAGTATNATNVATTLTTTNAAFYLGMFPANTSSNQAANVATALAYNPSTQVVTIPTAQITTLNVSGGDTNISNSLTVSNSTGAVTMANLATSSDPTTGTMCWTTGTGNINVDTTTTCLISSKKYKQNGRPLEDGQLAKVMSMQPQAYELRPEFNPTGLGEQIGLYAEDVAKVDDRLVSKEDDGSPHAVRYQQLTAVLIKAIQEQQQQIARLVDRISAMEYTEQFAATH